MTLVYPEANWSGNPVVVNGILGAFRFTYEPEPRPQWYAKWPLDVSDA